MAPSRRGARLRLLLAALCVAAWSACVPLTFSNKGAIDFDRYRSVRVSVNAPFANASEYFAAELRDGSGFESVTTDPAVAVDLVLTVAVNVTSETTVDSEGNTDTSYEAVANYRAEDPSGRQVIEGWEDDDSEWSDEAAQDVLDEVALVFLRDYRL